MSLCIPLSGQTCKWTVFNPKSPHHIFGQSLFCQKEKRPAIPFWIKKRNYAYPVFAKEYNLALLLVSYISTYWCTSKQIMSCCHKRKVPSPKHVVPSPKHVELPDYALDVKEKTKSIWGQSASDLTPQTAHKKRPRSVLEVMIAARGLPEVAQDGPKTV